MDDLETSNQDNSLPFEAENQQSSLEIKLKINLKLRKKKNTLTFEASNVQSSLENQIKYITQVSKDENKPTSEHEKINRLLHLTQTDSDDSMNVYQQDENTNIA